MKSSTNTSTYAVGFDGKGRDGSRRVGTGSVGNCGNDAGSGAGGVGGVEAMEWARLSSGCEGWGVPSLMMLFARSAAVSVAAVKMGGEFVHPIGRTRGRATSGGAPGLVGKTTPNLGMSLGFTAIL